MTTQDPREQIASELQVNTALLNEHLETNSARYSYWASLAADAKREAYRAKVRVEVTEAELVAEARTRLAAAGGRAAEWVVKNEVKRDPRWAQVWNDYNDAIHRQDIIESARVGFFQRKDILVAIAANLRGEMGGQVRVFKKDEFGQSTTPSPPSSQTHHQPSSGADRLHNLQATFRDQQENSK